MTGEQPDIAGWGAQSADPAAGCGLARRNGRVCVRAISQCPVNPQEEIREQENYQEEKSAGFGVCRL
jgi:hypothetical protein